MYKILDIVHDFAQRNRRWLLAISFIGVAMSISGCGSIASDASTVLTVISLGLATISTALVFIPGGQAFAGLVAEAAGVVSNLQAEFKSWQANPNATTFQNLMNLANDLDSKLQSILQGSGLPAAAITKIQAIVQACLTQLQNWINLVKNLMAKSGTASTNAPTAAHAAMVVMSDAELHTQLKEAQAQAHGFHDQLKQIVDTPTGDTEVDDAFAKAASYTQG